MQAQARSSDGQALSSSFAKKAHKRQASVDRDDDAVVDDAGSDPERPVIRGIRMKQQYQASCESRIDGAQSRAGLAARERILDGISTLATEDASTFDR